MFRLLLPLIFTPVVLSLMPPEPGVFWPNWTTCEEFLNNAEFDAMKIVDIDWKIFYFFSPEIDRSFRIRFHLPSATLINRFKMSLDDLITPKINWMAAELFMESTVDISALLIRTNVSGLYLLVSSMSFERGIGLTQEFAFKLVEPGYLGIANCWVRRAYALAPANRMPKVDEIEEAAAKLNFRCDFNHSYVEINSQSGTSSTTPGPYKDTDDREDMLSFDENREEVLNLF